MLVEPPDALGAVAVREPDAAATLQSIVVADLLATRADGQQARQGLDLPPGLHQLLMTELQRGDEHGDEQRDGEDSRLKGPDELERRRRERPGPERPEAKARDRPSPSQDCVRRQARMTTMTRFVR